MKKNYFLFSLLLLGVYSTSMGLSRAWAQNPATVTLTAVGPQNSDTVQVFHPPGATTGFDAGLDSQKVFSGAPQDVELFTNNGGVQYTRDARPHLSVDYSLTLGIALQAGQTCTLQVDLSGDFPLGVRVELEDTATGNRLPLSSAATNLTFQATGTDSTRFRLHYTGGISISTSPAGCDSLGGELNAASNTASSWDLYLLASNGDTLRSDTAFANATQWDSLPAGVHLLHARDSLGYLTVDTVTLSAQPQPQAAIANKPDTTYINTLLTLVAGGGATYQWRINNQLSTGPTWQGQFPFQGDYPIRLVAYSADSCTDTLFTNLIVLDTTDTLTSRVAAPSPPPPSLRFHQGRLKVLAGGQALPEGQVLLRNVLGQLIGRYPTPVLQPQDDYQVYIPSRPGEILLFSWQVGEHRILRKAIR